MSYVEEDYRISNTRATNLFATKLSIVWTSTSNAKKRAEKTTIIRSVIDQTLRQGGRFLKYDYSSTAWYDGGMAAAKARVGVAFRDARSPTKKMYIAKMKREAAEARSRSASASSMDDIEEEEDEEGITMGAFLSALPSSFNSLTTNQNVSATTSNLLPQAEDILSEAHLLHAQQMAWLRLPVPSSTPSGATLANAQESLLSS
jgi:hypothetical protein